MKLPSFLFIILSFFILSDFAPVYAETTIGDLSARIDDLERLIQEGELPAVTPSVEKELQALKVEINALKTTIHDLRHEIAQLRLHSTAADAGFNPESALRASPPLSPSESLPSSTAAGKPAANTPAAPAGGNADENATRQMARSPGGTSLPTGSEQAQYDQALALFNKQEYAAAERAFRHFNKTYSQSPFVSKALYWMGECCLAQKTPEKLRQAKKYFIAAYQKDKSENSNAPEALFKLGTILMTEGAKENACTVWKQIKTDYPYWSKKMEAQISAAQKKAGCTK